MIGRADKGLIITTRVFQPRAAHAEAIRDGAPAIDLVDGQELADLLKKCELGVQVRNRQGRKGRSERGLVQFDLKQTEVSGFEGGSKQLSEIGLFCTWM